MLVLAFVMIPTTPRLPEQPAVPTSGTLANRLTLVPLDSPRPVPDLRFVTAEGRILTLEDFRGRAVVLNIWATWCVPCRVEMPALDRLQAALGSDGFEVVALSIDRGGPPAVEVFYKEIGLRSLNIYVDPTGAASRALNAVGIPTTLLIDRDGREVARKIGPAEWDSPELVGAIRRHLDLPEGTGVAPVVAPTPRR
ncbi:TlpA family protein disulfide reductase [Falsiroseomonas tokyonensis]|uniref:TlpA family protein disulfide reductase n=1 Tax=Falsiroseomonas tokyonensis TaxID=430521 RepID=A0ABV7C3K3_9PROT